MLFLVEIIYFYMYMLLLNLAPQYFSRESIKFLSVNCINMKVSAWWKLILSDSINKLK